MMKNTIYALLITSLATHALERYPFSLLDRGYANNALEPYIDKETMRVHYEGHHKAYVEKLNEALKSHPELHMRSCRQLLVNLDKVPQDIRQAVRNNAGGHYNHTFFWDTLAPSKAGIFSKNEPSKYLLKAIESHFGSFKNFKSEFEKAAQRVFGSGWAWLCYDRADKKLVIVTTQNQDNPIMEGLEPILGLDVWEHAYYLKYENKRMDYVKAWWNVINWTFVEETYKKVSS